MEWRFPLLKSRPKPNTHRLCVRVLASVSASVWIRDPRHITRYPRPPFSFLHAHACAQAQTHVRPPYNSSHSASVLSDVVCPSHLSSLWATPCDLDRICDCKLCAVVRMPHSGTAVGAPAPAPAPAPSPSTWLACVHRLYGSVSQRQRRSLKPPSSSSYIEYILVLLRRRDIE